MPDCANPLLVYIVDDDASVRTGLARLMRASGLEAQGFATPEAFLAAISAKSKGCVLLDLSMPQLTGLDVQARLRAMGAQLPVIVVSASDSLAVREAARTLGAQFFLRKPVDEQALLDAIAWVTESRDPGGPTAVARTPARPPSL